MKEIPTFDVVPSKDRVTVSFYCPYCKHKHIHGNVGFESKENHRVAHCFKQNSPLMETVYYLRYKA